MNVQVMALKPGDILVYWGTVPGTKTFIPSHIALACGDKHILHNTISKGPGFAGVVKQAAGHAAQSFLGLDGTKIEVFRLVKDEQLASLAAGFGEKWAAPEIITKGADFEGAKKRAHDSVDQGFTKKDFDFQPLTKQMNPWVAHDGKVDFKTFGTNKSPYSTGRLEVGQTSPLQPWTQESAFRAVKAYVRACTEQGLSPRHGTSCDQFVMYCFQAASLKKNLGELKLDEQVIQLVKENSKAIKLYLKPQEPSKELAEPLKNLDGPAWDNLRETLKILTGNETSTGFLPQELTTDAKTSSVQKLFERIGSEHSGFKYVGSLKKNASIDTTLTRTQPLIAPSSTKEEVEKK